MTWRVTRGTSNPAPFTTTPISISTSTATTSKWTIGDTRYIHYRLWFREWKLSLVILVYMNCWLRRVKRFMVCRWPLRTSSAFLLDVTKTAFQGPSGCCLMTGKLVQWSGFWVLVFWLWKGARRIYRSAFSIDLVALLSDSNNPLDPTFSCTWLVTAVTVFSSFKTPKRSSTRNWPTPLNKCGRNAVITKYYSL